MAGVSNKRDIEREGARKEKRKKEGEGEGEITLNSAS
jgi:hypothetical protein